MLHSLLWKKYNHTTHMTKSHGSFVFWRVYGVWPCVLIRVSQQFVLHLMCGGCLMYWCCCYCFLIGAYRAKAFTPKCCIVVIIVAGACLQAKQSVLHCWVRLQHVVSILADGYGWLVVGCYNSSSFSFVFVVGWRWNFYEWKLFLLLLLLRVCCVYYHRLPVVLLYWLIFVAVVVGQFRRYFIYRMR